MLTALVTIVVVVMVIMVVVNNNSSSSSSSSMVVVVEVVAAAEVSHTLSAERGGRGGCPKWVVFCSSQAGRVVQTRGAPHQPTLFTIPRWLAGGAAHLDHTLPPRRSPTPCLLKTLGAEVVHSGLFFVPPGPGAWSKRAAPHTNPHYLLFRAGWRGAPPIWTTPCRREGLPHPVC